MLKRTENSGPRCLDERRHTLQYPTGDTIDERRISNKDKRNGNRAADNVQPVARGSPAARLRSLVARPLAIEANMVQPTPSFDVRERLGTAPAPRGRSSESRLGTRSGPPQVAHQATTSIATQPTRTPLAQRISQADPAAVIDMSKISELLRNRPDPSNW